MAVSAARRPDDRPLAVQMARAIERLDFEACAPEVVAKAKLCILDWLSSAFASKELPWALQARSVARLSSAGVDVTRGAGIVGTDEHVSVLDAAFVNGVIGHGLVRDDMHVGSISHLGTVILPALLALATTRAVSGKAFLAAMTVGYEVGGKIGRMILDAEVARVFRPTGITGPIAAAAAGSKLFRLSLDETAVALALATNTAAGYNEWAATGGSEMFFQTGFAARSGVSAVLLAAGGAYASPTAIDGSAGLLAAFRKNLRGDVPELFADRPEILAVFFKPVPACNYAQSAAQAALAIAARERVRSDDIERIVVRVTRAAALYPGCDASGPFEHVLQAKMSIHYNVAAALLNGNFDERNYVPQTNPQTLALAARTSLEVDAELTEAYPGKQGAEVVVHGRSGDVWRARVEDVVPTDAAGVRQRFADAAAQVLETSAAASLEKLIDGLEACDDARRLCRAVAPKG